MDRSTQILVGMVCAALVASAAHAGQGQSQSQNQSQPQGQQGTPAPTPATPEATPTYTETVVVTASKTSEQLVDAPATMTVIDGKTLQVSPSTNFADVLRNVPGLNVTQLSARDINVNSRAATSSLSTSQLALVDGRSLYLDFFGFVMWDFMPVNVDEIKQIEVIRGPASAVWGANALDGVVNVITKAPRDMQGTTFTAGVGDFDRNVGATSASRGSLFYVNTTHAAAVNDRLAYKVSAGDYSSDALARPIGLVPNGLPNNMVQYPPFGNTGTAQPKIDARVDYDLASGAKLQFSGGVGATAGILESGIGPFDIARGSTLGYAKINYTKHAFKLQAFTNILDGSAKNLLSVDPTGNPVNFVFNTKTTDIEVGDVHVLGTKQALTYGGNVRVNQFHLTIAPSETLRTEGGAYAQDEVMLSRRYRLVAGARVDKFSSIDDAVFSPRAAFIIKPAANHSVRVTYNRAFRAPSMINDNLGVTIANPLPLGSVNPIFGSQTYLVPTDVKGNPNLTPEYTDAFEVGYTGNIKDRARLSAAWYLSKFSNEIFFTQTETWASAPPGFPGIPAAGISPNALWALLGKNGITFPEEYSYRNLGQERNQGVELGIDATVTPSVTAFANYSFQKQPVPDFPGYTATQALAEVNLPARNKVNAGLSCSTTHGFGTLTVSYSDKAFWQDILDARYHGTTEPYTLVNLTVGTRWDSGRYSVALKITNLGDEQVMEHVFGDVIRRQMVAEFRTQLK